jgi:hypothetical protein
MTMSVRDIPGTMLLLNQTAYSIRRITSSPAVIFYEILFGI